jgi:hypothetical protein
MPTANGKGQVIFGTPLDKTVIAEIDGPGQYNGLVAPVVNPDQLKLACDTEQNGAVEPDGIVVIGGRLEPAR